MFVSNSVRPLCRRRNWNKEHGLRINAFFLSSCQLFLCLTLPAKRMFIYLPISFPFTISLLLFLFLFRDRFRTWVCYFRFRCHVHSVSSTASENAVLPKIESRMIISIHWEKELVMTVVCSVTAHVTDSTWDGLYRSANTAICWKNNMKQCPTSPLLNWKLSYCWRLVKLNKIQFFLHCSDSMLKSSLWQVAN